MAEYDIDMIVAVRKWNDLLDYLAEYRQGGLMLAFSGGVDSSLLAKAARLALAERVAAVCFALPLTAAEDTEQARLVAEQIGISLEIVTTSVLNIRQVENNCRDRCYYCKRHLYGLLGKYAEKQGFTALADGNNSDDSAMSRPGMRAAAEAGVLHPLVLVGLTKQEIRYLAYWQGLSNYAQPANACLATRFPYDTPLTEEALHRVEAGEYLLHRAGFGAVRLRVHGQLARIEVQLPQLVALTERQDIVAALRRLGFKYITADLGGLNSGSMDL